LKGGLDTNTQQYISINPPIKTGFEQKSIIQMLVVNVINAWRAMQLLYPSPEMEEYSWKTYKKLLFDHSTNLQEISYNLATSLIQSATNPYFHNVLFQTHNATATITINWYLKDIPTFWQLDFRA
jgi:hypothetical protein